KPRGWLPGVRHAACRRAAAPASGGGALLGAAHWSPGRPPRWRWHGGRVRLGSRVLPSQRAVRAGGPPCPGTNSRGFGSRAGWPHAGDRVQCNPADLSGEVMQDRLPRRPLIAAVLALAAIPARAAERSRVVATFSVLGDMTTRIAGDKVQLTTIVGG